MYTAAPAGQYIKIIDAKSGATRKQIRFTGSLIQGPIVTGDELSITVRINPTLTYMLVYNMSSGSLRRKIRI